MKRIFYLFILLTFISCDKEPERYYVSEEFKEWTLFQTGTYWVFKSDLGETDSIAVINSFQTMYAVENGTACTFCPKIDHYEEKYEMDHYSSFLDSTFIYSDKIFPNYIRSKMYGQKWLEQDCELGEECGSGVFSEFYDTITINNNLFEKVAQIEFEVSEYRKNWKFYVAKNFGIIKKIVKDSSSTTTWELERWNIVQ